MRSFTLCVLTLLAAPVAAEEKGQWSRVSPKGARCSVEMPGKPATQPVQEINQNGVKTQLYMFILETDGGKSGYGLGYCDFSVNQGDEKKVLAGAQDGTVKALKGKVVAERDLKLGKYPGREFTLELEGGNHYRGRLFLVDGRLYQVIVLGTKDFVNGADARSALYSFELE